MIHSRIGPPLLLALLFLRPCSADEPVPGKQVALRTTVKVTRGGRQDEAEIRYLQFVPQSYSNGKPLPMILFLHGAGERGTNIELVKKWGPPRIAEKRADYPFIVVAPQAAAGKGWEPAPLLALVDHVCQSINVDQQRIYVTGLSMGGYGTWDLLAAAPQRFAAGLPLCGGYDPAHAKKLVDVPIWAHQGERDRPGTLKAMKDMVEAIRAAGGKKVQLKLYPDRRHNVWSPAYADPAVYQWLLAQRRVSKDD